MKTGTKQRTTKLLNSIITVVNYAVYLAGALSVGIVVAYELYPNDSIWGIAQAKPTPYFQFPRNSDNDRYHEGFRDGIKEAARATVSTQAINFAAMTNGTIERLIVVTPAASAVTFRNSNLVLHIGQIIQYHDSFTNYARGIRLER